ncbi:MAG: septation protein SpoVG family protein [Bdellovibrionaceae bacterium]|nr:septation protein SpoVG family protein [Pseudobdellovibrionaceae bacterium]
MNISVTLKEVLGANKLKARARVYINDNATGFSLNIEGLRVIDDGVKAPWIAMPQEKYWKGDEAKYKDIVSLNEIAKDQVFSSILTEYKKLKD